MNVFICSTSWDEISLKERKLKKKRSNYVSKTHHFISRIFFQALLILTASTITLMVLLSSLYNDVRTIKMRKLIHEFLISLQPIARKKYLTNQM